MRKIAILLISIGIILLCFYYVYNYTLEQNRITDIDNYIEKTRIVEDEVKIIEKEENKYQKTEDKAATINYKAILEIPSINLKNGLVEATKNFKSINYAVSIDNSSNYPSQNGNFILYAHSGRSKIAYFKNLNQVQVNDLIYIYFNGYKYVYQVYEKYEIEKIGTLKTEYPNDKKIITLLTCKSGTDKQIVILGKNLSQESY